MRSATLGPYSSTGLMIAFYSVTRSLGGTPALLRWGSRYKRWLHFLIVESMCSFHVKSADSVTLKSLDCFTLSMTVPLVVSGTKFRDPDTSHSLETRQLLLSLEGKVPCRIVLLTQTSIWTLHRRNVTISSSISVSSSVSSFTWSFWQVYQL